MKLLSKQTRIELLTPLSVWQFWNHPILVVVYTQRLQGSWSPKRVSSAWLPCKDEWHLRTWLLATKCPSCSPAEQPASPQERGQWARSCQLLCRNWQNVPLLPGTHSPVQRCFGLGYRWRLDVSHPLPFPPACVFVVALGDSRWHVGCYWVTNEGHGTGAEASLHGLLHGLLKPLAQKSQVS